MKTEDAERMRRVVIKLSRRLNAASTAAGLTPSQASVLGVVAGRGPIGVPAIVAAEELNPTMVSRLLTRLEELGLVLREARPGDQRQVAVTATEAGQLLARKIRRERGVVVQRLVEGMDAAAQARVAEAFGLLERQLDEPVTAPARR